MGPGLRGGATETKVRFARLSLAAVNEPEVAACDPVWEGSAGLLRVSASQLDRMRCVFGRLVAGT
jgi:hypothetical protein